MKKKSSELAVYQKMSATMRSTKKTNLLIKFVQELFTVNPQSLQTFQLTGDLTAALSFFFLSNYEWIFHRANNK